MILVDGSALMYRAYYAFVNRPLTSPSGEPTSVVFGFCNSILGMVERFQPTHLSVVFDLPGKTFRHDIYPDYKANRKPMPDDLAIQVPRLRELLAAWGLSVLDKEGFEADDIMATLARQSTEVCEQAWFYTGDKDFMQLLDHRTGMLKPGRRGEEVTPFTLADLEKVYALPPAALIDVFALSGDKVDNIPGAPGVGEKTALKLIRQFGDLDSLYQQLDTADLTPRLRRVLGENRDQVYLSRRLFVIDQGVDLTVAWDSLRTCLPESAAAHELLEELGLRRVLSNVKKLVGRGVTGAGASISPAREEAVATAARGAQRDAGESRSTAAGEATSASAKELQRRGYIVLTRESELVDYLSKVAPQAPLAVDTETDSLRQDRARLVGISLATPGLPAAYLPILWREEATRGADAGATLFATGAEVSSLSWVQPLLAPVLSDESHLKVGQNLKYDEWVLTRHGLPLAGSRFDTMVAAYVLDPGRQHSRLDDLAGEFLGESMISYNELFEAHDKQQDILSVPLARLALYAAEDADVTLRLHELLRERLQAAGLNRLFTEIEMPLSVVLFAMERNGIKIDTGFLAGLQERFTAQMQELEQQIHAAAGEPFNIQSPKQLSHILFEKIKLKPVKKTASGWSTDMSVLQALADAHPLPGLILEYRQLAKLQNTYVESLPELVNPETGLIHTSYNQAVAATGRLSSSDPNLQNIPVRSETGRQIRQAFVPRAAENRFLSADYSQIELRLLAHLSGDARLTAAFREGGDVHRRTAALIAGVDEDEVTSGMRSRAKAINFGVIYGMGAVALGKQIHVPTKEAKTFIETYFTTYPGVREFIEQTKVKARQDGYVETLLGRRRLLPDINSSNNRIRSLQERIAVNTPIQGTAADLIKLAMIRIQADLQQQGLSALLLLQVHDELVLEVPAAELDQVKTLVKERMEAVMSLNVALQVDMHVGANWAEAHD
jgi:DNA polymerase-1